jgi:hypothetical protein
MQSDHFLKQIENVNAINQAIDLGIDQSTFEPVQPKDATKLAALETHPEENVPEVNGLPPVKPSVFGKKSAFGNFSMKNGTTP